MSIMGCQPYNTSHQPPSWFLDIWYPHLRHRIAVKSVTSDVTVSSLDVEHSSAVIKNWWNNSISRSYLRDSKTCRIITVSTIECRKSQRWFFRNRGSTRTFHTICRMRTYWHPIRRSRVAFENRDTLEVSVLLAEMVVVAGFGVTLDASLAFLGMSGISLLGVDAARRRDLLHDLRCEWILRHSVHAVNLANWLLKTRLFAARWTGWRDYHLRKQFMAPPLYFSLYLSVSRLFILLNRSFLQFSKGLYFYWYFLV